MEIVRISLIPKQRPLWPAPNERGPPIYRFFFSPIFFLNREPVNRETYFHLFFLEQKTGEQKNLFWPILSLFFLTYFFTYFFVTYFSTYFSPIFPAISGPVFYLLSKSFLSLLVHLCFAYFYLLLPYFFTYFHLFSTNVFTYFSYIFVIIFH